MLVEDRLNNEGGVVDVLPLHRDAARRVGRAPPPRRHQQVAPPLLLQLPVELADLGGDLSRLRLRRDEADAERR